nr:reverse transcriptase domain-containing protein [Tanacetum cinerariifolium]
VAERNKTISEEVKKLVEADIMKEVHYHRWISNPRMVKKHDDSWRMCVDFKDLNKACPKDGYPLPKINWKVESLYGYPYKCFLDAYKGYHQIKMTEEDEEKTAFITSQGIFCYSKMPFGLKNAGATYQRLVDKSFQKQIGQNLEYRPRTSVKGQILANFIVECPEDDTPDTSMEGREELPDPCILFTDGSSCIDLSRAGLIITNPEGMEFTYAIRFRFNATNNEAEYEALIAGLWIAGQMGVQNLQENMDSKLVANQVNGIYIAKESSMIKYLEKVKNLASTFKGFSIKKIPRGENKKADALSKITSTSFAHWSKQVLMEELREKSIDEKRY